MASTITITCPECDKQMKGPAEVLGKKIRCKGCGATFLARAGTGASAPAPAKPAAKPAGKPAAKQNPGKPAGGKAPAAKAEKPAKKPSEDDEDNSPYGYTEEKLGNRCPDCANEMETEEAVICLHCGYNRETRTKARMRKVAEITGGDVFLWLLPGILCALGLLILFVFNIIFVVYSEEWFDPDAWYSFFGGKAAKIWLVVISLFWAYLGGKFAIRRLIMDNRPPEIEVR